eukprot:3975535-Pleurochrysis_carterae.AAC.1
MLIVRDTFVAHVCLTNLSSLLFRILFGLGFADHLVPMDRKTKHMSGGWRMRVSLAKARSLRRDVS